MLLHGHRTEMEAHNFDDIAHNPNPYTIPQVVLLVVWVPMTVSAEAIEMATTANIRCAERKSWYWKNRKENEVLTGPVGVDVGLEVGLGVGLEVGLEVSSQDPNIVLSDSPSLNKEPPKSTPDATSSPSNVTV